ncbi:putative toxin-antitoxin system toxin component, PIN family [Desulfoscipio gibsoniae]|uniref:Putative toxin-antitoxin system toxin component, PIN family n=1 Tax=Desulfoscipio gibsoniae DSM 7213 TaxID=767817 RepID=R4KB32_9FIRM|nr:putative toxin-antitoxin system toxin component, PIN family [Desulfoscipio gibsoniae]AGL00388.1 putative toxin-antitoxin system toxin component, PIN family [Desulfoscipio gibsoniae DSM 7213]
MKVLADTNILISALLWPHSKPAATLLHAARYHELVLCDRNIFELRDVLGRKAPYALADVEVFLAELAYDLVPAPEYPQKLISDPKDQPILNAAIVADVDIIISGDKHFLKLNMERPRVMTAAQYLEWIETEQ